MDWICDSPGCGERFGNAGALGRHARTHRLPTRRPGHPHLATSQQGLPAAGPQTADSSEDDRRRRGTGTPGRDEERVAGHSEEDHGQAGAYDEDTGTNVPTCDGDQRDGSEEDERDDNSGRGADDDDGRGSDSDSDDGGDDLPAASLFGSSPSALPSPADPTASRKCIKPAVARLANMVQRAGLKLHQVDWVLRYLREVPADELTQLPNQGRTVMRQVERFGALALRTRTDASRPEQLPDAVPANFAEREYEYGTERNGRRFGIKVHLRNLWNVLCECFLEDPDVAPQLHFGAVMSVNDAGERVYSEMWTGQWWARAEAALPHDCRLLAIILHIDDTPQAGQSVCPVYATLGNLSMETRRLGPMMPVVAYIPKLTGTKGEKKTTAFRRAKRVLIHRVIRDLLEPVELVRQRGGANVLVAGHRLHLVPQLAIVIADNEEKAVLSLTFKKPACSSPCHECLVPRDKFGDTVLTATQPFARRRPDDAHAIMTAASSRDRATAAEGRRRAKAASVWPLPNAFWLLTQLFNIYLALPPDLLHDADLGVFKRLVLAIYAYLERVAPAAADELDRRLFAMSMTAAPGLAKRFGDGGFRALERAEGAHYRALMQLLPLALRGLDAVPAEAVALAAEWPALYAALRAHAITKSELDRWQLAAAEWGARLQVWSASGLSKRAFRRSEDGRESGAAGSGDDGDDDEDDSDDASDGCEADGRGGGDDDGDDDGDDGASSGVPASKATGGGAEPKPKRARRDRQPPKAAGFPKLHALLGGHMRDAIQRFGVPANFNAAPFEGRHITAVKQPARKISGAVGLLPQLARLARREELLDAVTHRASAGPAQAPPARRNNDARLSWPADGTTTIEELERRLRVRDLELMTVQYLLREATEQLRSRAAAVAVARGRIQELHRLETAEGQWAYANRNVHGRERHDDVAINAGDGALWYGRLIALMRFQLPEGPPLEAVLVRWYEAVAPLRELGEPADASVRRAITAVNAACRRLKLVFNMSWCAPEAILRRESIVLDWAVANPSRGDTIGIGTTVFANGFVRLVNGQA